MALPVATRLVAAALHEEADRWAKTEPGMSGDAPTIGGVAILIAVALRGVAERLEAGDTGAPSVAPREASFAPPTPAPGQTPGSGVEAPKEASRGLTEVPSMISVHATLVELKSVLGGRLHNDARARQLLDDAIALSDRIET